MRMRFFLILMMVAGSAGFAKAQFNIGDRAGWRLSMLQRAVGPLYRKPSNRELKAVEPRRELFDRYAALLREPETGLTKLIADRGCAENTKVLVVKEDCLKYSMPGAGSSFSFRIENYRIPRLADLTYTDNSFQATGVLLLGIFVNIGDVPLAEVSEKTRGLRYLSELVPPADYEKSKKLDSDLSRGVIADGFLYRRGLYMKENTTFVLRSVAFGGRYLRATGGVTYNEFDFDKRRDVTVAFRVVEKDDAGDVVILWKKLREKDSPKIKRSSDKKVNP